MDIFEIRRLNLKYIIERDFGGNASAFARKIRKDSTYINRCLYVEGKKGKKNISDEILEAIYESKLRHRGWMDIPHEVGEGDYIDSHAVREESPHPESTAHITRDLARPTLVPVVGAAQLGDDGYWCELEYPIGHGDGYVTYSVKDKNAYALRCVGDSMEPRIRSGEFVVVEPNRLASPGEDVMLKSLDGRVMVKTYLYTKDDRVHVMSINKAFKPQSFALSDVDKMHPVAGIANSLAWVKE